MKTIKAKFYVSTGYAGASIEEVMQIKVEETATPEEIDDQIQAEYEIWVNENTEQSWSIID